jgi:hypothetical protein
MSVDQARLRPHLRPAARNELFQSEHGPSTANGSDVTAPKRNGRVFKAEAGDLRGVPVVASQVAGVMPGTDPVRALLAKEQRRERRQA